MELVTKPSLRSDDSDAAVLAAETMGTLGVSDGDAVRIEHGDSVTAIRVRTGANATTNDGEIRLQPAVRRSLDVERGDTVEVTATVPEPAERVTLSLPPNLSEAAAFDIVEALEGRPIVGGQTLTLDDDGPANGHTAAADHGTHVYVDETKPDGVVAVKGWTSIRISGASFEAPVTRSVGSGAAPGYDDIGGMESIIEQLREAVEAPLATPEPFDALGVDPPGGVLVHGPPGTGKTLLVRALAAEADLPLIQRSGAELVAGDIDGTDPFESALSEAEARAPSILFFDDLDALTGERSGELDHRRTARLIATLDDHDPSSRVVVIGTTTDPGRLDPSLRRSGRFGREIAVPVPDRNDRRRILSVATRAVPLADDVDLDRLAARTIGLSGADLENLVNEAALLAAREQAERVDASLLDRARDKIMLGTERETRLSTADRERVAYHESGHALLSCLLEHTDPVAKITIVPRGQALGATEQVPEEERYNLPESYLRDRITAMFGGRVAERLVYGEVSSGAKDDLQQATRLARSMVAQWGMSDQLGPVGYRQGEEHVFLGREMAQQRDFSEQTAQLVDEEVRNLVRALEQRAEKLLSAHQERLRALARRLLEREVLEADEIGSIVGPGSDASDASDTSTGPHTTRRQPLRRT